MAVISGVIIFFLTRYALNHLLTCLTDSASMFWLASPSLVHNLQANEASSHCAAVLEQCCSLLWVSVAQPLVCMGRSASQTISSQMRQRYAHQSRLSPLCKVTHQVISVWPPSKYDVCVLGCSSMYCIMMSPRPCCPPTIHIDL